MILSGLLLAALNGWPNLPFPCRSAPLCAEAEISGGDSNLFPVARIMEGMNQLVHDDPATDGELVERARRGEVAAFGALYDRHAGRLLPALWRLSGGDHGHAEDLLQESFVQAWQRLDQLRDPERFGGWLKQVAVNRALGDRRRLRAAGDDTALAHLADVEPPWPSADLDLERAIAALPERARHVLVLFCLEGYSHEEIARTLGIEAGTSKGQLHRARNLLREALS